MAMEAKKRNGDASVYTVSSDSDLTSDNRIANQSSDYLVQITSRASLFQKRNFYKNAVIILAICVIILLLGLVIIVTLHFLCGPRTIFNICTSEECLRSAANLRLSMNLSVDPCDDFYQFTCGRWSDEHPNHGWFSHFSTFETADERVIFSTLRFLTSNESKDEPLPVKQSRYLYTSCMDTDAADKLGYTVIFKYLKEVDLPLVPNYFTSDLSEDYKFDWVKTEVMLKKIFYMDTLIGFTIDADIYNRNNSVIYMGTPATDSQLPSYFRKRSTSNSFNNKRTDKSEDDDNGDEEDEDYDKEALTLIVKMVTKVLLENITTDVPTTEYLEEAAEVIWNFTSEVSELKEQNYTADENLDYYTFKIDTLHSNVNECLVNAGEDPISNNLWRRYLTLMFEDTNNVSLNLDGGDLIYVSVLELDYFCDILSLVSRTPDVVLELYFWWRTVDSMVVSTTSEISQYIWKIMAPFYSGSSERSRSIECASLVVNYMGIAVSYGIADKTILNSTKPKIERMLKDIKDAFIERVNEISWMDGLTKKATLEKSEQMISFIGYPEWFLEDGALEDYYENVTIKEDTYLENMINIVKTYTPFMLTQLGKESERSWRTDPITVNAYNYFSDNSINLCFNSSCPYGYLNIPFLPLRARGFKLWSDRFDSWP